MHLFYTPDIKPDANYYSLSEVESKHAIRVLRLVVGDQVHLIDGIGGLYTAVLTSADPRTALLRILEVRTAYRKRPYQLHIGIAPTKNIDRFEWFLEKATEIGIDRITPIICAHSERKIIKTDRLYKIVTAAVKQSLNAYHPTIDEPIFFSEFLQNNNVIRTQKLIAHCEPVEKLFINQLLQPQTDAIVLIGPEGDFSKTEIANAVTLGYQAISLGENRMRTETAGIAVCMELALLNR